MSNASASVFCVTGTIGHVAHGKSTVVKAISGVQVPCLCSIILCGVLWLSRLYTVFVFDSWANNCSVSVFVVVCNL